MPPEINAKSWLMIGTLGLVWGATFLFIELALRGISPFWLSAGRIGFASLLMGGIWILRGGKLFLTDHKDWPTLAIVVSLSTALPFMLLSWGMQYVTSGFAGVSMAAVTLVVLPLSHFLIPGERMTLRRTMGFLIGFVGILVLIGPSAFASKGVELENLGRVACLATAGCYAISSVLMRRLPPIDPIGLVAMTFLLGTVVVVPIAFVVEGPPPMVAPTTLFYVALLGLVPTAAANVLRVLVIRSAGPVFMSLTNYLVPLVSVILGALVLLEPVGPSLLLAMLLILSGVLISQYHALRKLFRRV